MNEKCRHYAAQKLVGLKWGNMIMTHATQVNFLNSISVLLKETICYRFQELALTFANNICF